MTIELIPLCTVTGTLAPPRSIGDGPAGTRLVIEVTDLATKGRLEAVQEGAAAADWITINNGIGTLDVRATVRTHDDALIYVQYHGRMATGGDNAGILYVTPRFETADERYLWLNGVQAIGKGGTEGPALTYDWYEVR